MYGNSTINRVSPIHSPGCILKYEIIIKTTQDSMIHITHRNVFELTAMRTSQSFGSYIVFPAPSHWHAAIRVRTIFICPLIVIAYTCSSNALPAFFRIPAAPGPRSLHRDVREHGPGAASLTLNCRPPTASSIPILPPQSDQRPLLIRLRRLLRPLVGGPRLQFPP